MPDRVQNTGDGSQFLAISLMLVDAPTNPPPKVGNLVVECKISSLHAGGWWFVVEYDAQTLVFVEVS